MRDPFVRFSKVSIIEINYKYIFGPVILSPNILNEQNPFRFVSLTCIKVSTWFVLS
jgi:hypothetical protein